jgi:hypothetical protein
VVAVFVRPNIHGEETRTALVAGPQDDRILPNPAVGNWMRETSVRAPDGHVLQTDGTSYCVPAPDAPAPPGGDGGCGTWDPQSYNQWTYQPGDRFWLFQWVEFGIYVVLAVALLYAALRRVRHSLS